MIRYRLTDRLVKKGALPGRGYTCPPTLSSLNTPLPDQVSQTGCDHVVTSLTCVPCCCDSGHISDTPDTSPPLEEPFGRIRDAFKENFHVSCSNILEI